MVFFFTCPLPEAEVRDRRAAIHTALCARWPSLCDVPVTTLPSGALAWLLDRYDRAFFAGLFAANAARVRITASTRMTRAAGTCTLRRAAQDAPPSVEIRMGVDFLFRLLEGPFDVNGLRAPDAIGAFLLVLEHEMCHAADALQHGSTDRHGPRFQALAKGLFGHRRCTHALPTRAQEAEAQGLGRGAWASFLYEKKTLSGRITRVGKTATVMVPASRGGWRDAEGRRYDKYTVPLSALTPQPERDYTNAKL